MQRYIFYDDSNDNALKTQARYTALVQRACFMMNNILNSVKILNMIIQKVLNCK